jgi:hypothetical protein
MKILIGRLSQSEIILMIWFLAFRNSARIAQLVEHLICNQAVGGSNPSAGSSFSPETNAFHMIKPFELICRPPEPYDVAIFNIKPAWLTALILLRAWN